MPHILLFGIFGTMENLIFPHIFLNPSLIHKLSRSPYDLIVKNKQTKSLFILTSFFTYSLGIVLSISDKADTLKLLTVFCVALGRDVLA